MMHHRFQTCVSVTRFLKCGIITGNHTFCHKRSKRRTSQEQKVSKHFFTHLSKNVTCICCFYTIIHDLNRKVANHWIACIPVHALLWQRKWKSQELICYNMVSMSARIWESVSQRFYENRIQYCQCQLC